MPLVNTSSYKAPFLLKNAHANTVFAALARKVSGVYYDRERIETPDGDFFDLDWSKLGNDKLVVALHGLEGSANRPYIRGMIREFNRNGWDGLGFNFRGCSGEPNRKPYSYHMGWTLDLEYLIEKILILTSYQEIALVGFSMGGNVILNYLGKKGKEVPKIIKKAVTFSVPCHIESANVEINKFRNKAYLMRFMNSLRQKVIAKSLAFPDSIQYEKENFPKNFYEFDEMYTAPLNGFKNNVDYWRSTSCINHLQKISIPTLLINSLDDTFLSKECFPKEIAKQNRHLYLEVTKNGGHVGFVSFSKTGSYWSEKRALEFVKNVE